MNGRVLLAGDLTLDLIKSENSFLTRPGGSILNTAVVLKRLLIECDIYSRIGDDIAGKVMLDFLKKNHIPLKNIIIDSNFKTSLALCELDGNGKPSYNFFKSELSYPDCNPELSDDILIFHFGSSFAYRNKSYSFINKILKNIKEKDIFTSYDLNLRTSPDTFSRFRILDLIRKTDFLKGSAEDFFYLFNMKSENDIISKLIKIGVKCGVITMAEKGALYFNTSEIVHIPVYKEAVGVSSVGAGDSFNGGVISAAVKRSVDKEDIKKIFRDSSAMKEIISYSSEVVYSYLNGFFAGSLIDKNTFIHYKKL